jgi:hypothetical protein
MRQRLWVLLIVFWSGCAGLAPAFAAEPVFPPGSPVGLVPPEGLTLSSKFPGFVDEAHHVAITITELSGPAYAALESSAFSGHAEHLLVEKRELFPFESGIGYLITGHEQVQGTTLRAWYLLFSTFNNKVGSIAALVAVHMPDEAVAVYPDKVVRAALKSVSLRQPPLAEVLKQLPFQLNDLAGFRVIRAEPPAVVFLIDGATNDMAHNPYLVISMNRGAPEADDARARFARDVMISLPIPNLKVTSAQTMRLGTGVFYETRADATGAGGTPLAVVQWMRFGAGSSFLRIIGVTPKNRWDDLFPRFRAVRDGIVTR